MEIVASSSFTRLSYVPPIWAAQSGPSRVGSRSMFSSARVERRQSISVMKSGNAKVCSVSRKRNTIKAFKRLSDSCGSDDPIAPLQLESPIGQFLSHILINHPHLIPAAVEQQLEKLQTDRDAEKENKEPSASGTEIVIYRRIAEVKANERKKALEEILYALVVQKFMDANVTLIPTITPSSPDNSGRIDTWPIQDEKLEHLHSPEAYEMIQNHLSLILGNQLGDSNSVSKISKLRVGQVYAASIMYGYFLKRVDQRFQLDKNVKILPQGIDDERSNVKQVIEEERRPDGIKLFRLRNYVMSFDGETLQRYATIRSKESISIIEKHTEALFGRPDEIVITPEGTIDSSKDERIKISFGGLRRLVLEAVTFGSFLWDVESYVDSRYHFVAN